MFKMRAKLITVGLLGAAVVLPLDLAKADQLGHASWYSLPANITANGEQMNPNELTAAHRSLPFGTRVLVENLSNGRSVVVRINDRGPFIGGRIIDLSKAAAASIGMINSGTAKVRVTTANGGVLADLGETTAKAKDGATSAAAAKVDIASLPATPRKASARSPAKTKHVSARATASLKPADARLKVKVAAMADRSKAGSRGRAYLRVAGSSDRIAASLNGIRAAAQQASHIPSRSIVVADTPEPYAILGATPGFTKPSRTRLRRAG